MTHDPMCPCGVNDPDPTHYCPDDLWDESVQGYFSDYSPIVAFLGTFAARVRADEREQARERVRLEQAADAVYTRVWDEDEMRLLDRAYTRAALVAGGDKA